MSVTRQRTSRWASPIRVSDGLPFIDDGGTPLPPGIQANMTAEQLEAYVTHFRIQEITAYLRLPNSALAPTYPPRHREPSPDPEYDAAGRRTNTRVQRRRRTLEDERHRLVDEATAKIASYRPPADYRRPTNFKERVYIPQADFPVTNFIGQILGPRGETLKDMERRGGAKLAIRGKGSVKEGRASHRAGARLDDSSQPLHVLITAGTQAKVEAGKKLIEQVIADAVSTPEWQNEHKKKQLRDLAIMNGTFRDDEGRYPNQRQRLLSDSPSTIDEEPPEPPVSAHVRSYTDASLDSEYERLMEDVGGRPKDDTGGRKHDISTLPPWRVDRLHQKGCL